MQTSSLHHDHQHSPLYEGQQQDPVCGMQVESASPFREQYKGEQYRFCSQKCQDKFRAEPRRYLGQPHGAEQSEHVQQPPPAAAGVVEYTCPMHPEIRQPGPGSCPICGMTLELVIPEL